MAKASTAWQFRDLQAEERLKQLTAGETTTEHRAEHVPAEHQLRPLWRRQWER